MKLPLIVSILINVVLMGLVVFWRPKADARLNSVPSGNAEDTVAISTRTEVALTTQTAQTQEMGEAAISKSYEAVWEGSTSDLLKQLRAWGAPNYMIVDILFAHDRHHYLKDRRLEILYPNGAKRWAGQPQSGKNIIAQLDALYSQRREELRQLVGPAFDVVLAESDPVQRLKWGNLRNDQVAEIKKIKEQYDSLALKNGGYTSSLGIDSIRMSALVDAEFSTDIRIVLNPAEAEDFLTYNSPAALALQKELSRAGVEVDEETYLSLLKRNADFRAELLKADNGSRLYENVVKSIQMYESVLGAERALALAASNMSNFQAIDVVLSSDGLDPATRLNIYYEYMQTTMKITDAQELMEKNPSVAQLHWATEGARFYQLLSSTLSPQKLEQLMKSREGRLIDQWRKGGR